MKSDVEELGLEPRAEDYLLANLNSKLPLVQGHILRDEFWDIMRWFVMSQNQMGYEPVRLHTYATSCHQAIKLHMGNDLFRRSGLHDYGPGVRIDTCMNVSL